MVIKMEAVMASEVGSQNSTPCLNSKFSPWSTEYVRFPQSMEALVISFVLCR